MNTAPDTPVRPPSRLALSSSPPLPSLQEADLSYMFPFWLLWCALMALALVASLHDRTLKPLQHQWLHASEDITKQQQQSDPRNWPTDQQTAGN